MLLFPAVAVTSGEGPIGTITGTVGKTGSGVKIDGVMITLGDSLYHMLKE